MPANMQLAHGPVESKGEICVVQENRAGFTQHLEKTLRLAGQVMLFKLVNLSLLIPPKLLDAVTRLIF